MGQIYRFLGLTVGCIQSQMDPEARRAAYHSDITYSTNNELGFDYLRDNMAFRVEDMVHRPFHFAIIDEVDSILIDEARTPLIISGPSEDTTDMYVRIDGLLHDIDPELYEKDEKTRHVMLTDTGVEHVEAVLREAGLMEEGSLYDSINISLLHHTNKALLAHVIYRRDVDYIVKDKKVVLIDPFTGRMMTGRRFGDGLHQALEAKEHVLVERETQTLASVTFQNFFRMYPKIAGMTGTAMTEAGEFREIYNLQVVSIPTHRAVSRKDYDDEIYRTMDEKNKAVVQQIKEAYERQQPVLVGTVSIEKSESLSALLKKEKIPHKVLNARHHEQEAQIIAQAGRSGMVTVATNMAGRGTDIKLGGSADLLLKTNLQGNETPEQVDAMRAQYKEDVEKNKEIVIQAGGLFVIGTERHESRRIDNQLRGRAGRQGDPGASKFYISLEDDLMRIFGAERIDAVLQKLGIREGQAITHPWISSAIERAQKKIEGQHFDSRRHVLRQDNVMNDQRKVVYQQRLDLMTTPTIAQTVEEIIEDVILEALEEAIPASSYKEKWQIESLHKALHTLSDHAFPIQSFLEEEGIGEQEFADKVAHMIQEFWAQKKIDFISSVEQHPDLFGLTTETAPSDRTLFAQTILTDMQRNVILQMLDKSWKEHLLNLDHLRMGIGLRGYAQRDPINEYKTEAFALFQTMMAEYRFDVAKTILSLAVTAPEQITALRAPRKAQPIVLTRKDPAADDNAEAIFPPPNATLRSAEPIVKQKVDRNDPNTWSATPRNEPCPCGSGKKYKHCHGAVAIAV
jgi:preprotein translocase subunit SecA